MSRLKCTFTSVDVWIRYLLLYISMCMSTSSKYQIHQIQHPRNGQNEGIRNRPIIDPEMVQKPDFRPSENDHFGRSIRSSTSRGPDPRNPTARYHV